MKRPKGVQGIRSYISARKPTIQEVVRETTSGGIIFRRGTSGQLEILLIRDAKNRWTIPKGHVEPDEEPKQTAEREIREETGLQEMRVMGWLGKVDFRYRRGSTLVLMGMHIYMVQGLGNTTRLNPEPWLSDIRWLPISKALDLIAYEDISKLILVGIKKAKEARI